MQEVPVIANGISTDHPLPGLPFVDDGDLPRDDPRAIEGLGRGVRHAHGAGWGRWDGDLRGEWAAFGTDRTNAEFAWCVRHHPDHGTTVVLVRAADAPSLHSQWAGEQPLLFRAGGYWWDGRSWYRPRQLVDPVNYAYLDDPVPDAVTVTAADLLATATHTPAAVPHTITDITPGAIAPQDWLAHLRSWAIHRPPNARPAASCVVTLMAPELQGDNLIGISELAALAGIRPGTLRGYRSRHQIELPSPQARISGRELWSREVGTAWAAAMTQASASHTPAPDEVTRGAADLIERFTALFLSRLQRIRGRGARTSTPETISHELATLVAGNLGEVVPARALAVTIRCAVLHQIGDDAELQANTNPASIQRIGFNANVAIMLDWLIRHHPALARTTIREIVHRAEEQWQLPRKTITTSLLVALTMDGRLARADYDKFFGPLLTDPRQLTNPKGPHV